MMQVSIDLFASSYRMERLSNFSYALGQAGDTLRDQQLCLLLKIYSRVANFILIPSGNDEIYSHYDYEARQVG